MSHTSARIAAGSLRNHQWRKAIRAIRQALQRLGVVQWLQGWRVANVPLGPLVIGAEACGCGRRASRMVAPWFGLKVWGRIDPDVKVGQCDRCYVMAWWWRVGWLGVAIGMAVGAVVGVRLVLELWPGMPMIVGVFGCVVTAAGLWVAGAQVIQRRLSARFPQCVSSLFGVGVVVVDASKSCMQLETVRPNLLRELEAAGHQVEVSATRVLLQPVVPLYLSGVVTVLALCLWLWPAWHPRVRIVNFSSETMEVRVDGKRVAVVAGVPGESPRSGVDVRVMSGRRTFASYMLDGTRVDMSSARVRQDATQVYVSQSSARCVWIEQRVYGKAGNAKTRIVAVRPQGQFYSFPVAVDAWFQPTPPVSKSAWFSGGVRRSLRQGSCDELEGLLANDNSVGRER